MKVPWIPGNEGSGCGKVQNCELVNLRTDQWVNCRPKLADRQCGPVGKLWTTKMRTHAIERLMRDVP